MKLHIPAKIIIGTIPLQVVTQQYQTHPGVSAPQLSAQASSYLPTSIPTPSAPPMADTLPKSNTRESGLKVELGLIYYYIIYDTCVFSKVSFSVYYGTKVYNSLLEKRFTYTDTNMI